MIIPHQQTETIREAVEQQGYAITSPLTDEKIVRKTLQTIRATMVGIPDNPTLGTSPEDMLGNYQKLCVGGVFESSIYRPRLLRIGYSPFWSEDLYGMHELGRIFAGFRNQVLGLPDSFAIDEIENDRRYSALRFQHYPKGGGFLVEHRDIVNVANNEHHKFEEFIQFLLPLTVKGEDYSTGGGFLIDKNNCEIDVDSTCPLGGVIIYSGTLSHGVREIDPNYPFLPFQSAGRIVMMASLFKKFDSSERSRYKLIQ